MNYDYNGNLLFAERINKVADAIITKYPEIKKEEAAFIASLEPPITTQVTDEIKFRRLFNIMFVKQNDKYIENKVFYDITEIYKNIYGQNDKIDNLMNLLVDHMLNGSVFPLYE